MSLPRYLTRVVGRALWERRAAPQDVQATATTTRHRVRLADVDLNRHMNQAAYPAVCEMARVSWLFRSGAWPAWEAAGLNPVVARQELVYRRELKPLQAFTIDSRAVGAEGRLLLVDHTILVGDRVHALNHVRLLFVGPEGVLGEEEVRELAAPLRMPPLRVEGWRVAA